MNEEKRNNENVRMKLKKSKKENSGTKPLHQEDEKSQEKELEKPVTAL